MKQYTSDKFSELNSKAELVAPLILGSILERRINNEKLLFRIVEVEAYDETDPASHSYKGSSKRTEVMFGKAGTLYVYFTYGMHYCCNIVVGPQGYGSAVLIRAVEPVIDINQSQFPLKVKKTDMTTNGPAKLCVALGIDKNLNGHNLRKPPLKLIILPKLPDDQIVRATRIGISLAKDVKWRFYIKDNPYVSFKIK